MKKILINIENNTICFAYKTSHHKINNDLINTNIISNNELIFSDIYIEQNKKILTSFIKELTVQYHINKVIVKELDLAFLVISLLNKCTEVTSLYII